MNFRLLVFLTALVGAFVMLLSLLPVLFGHQPSGTGFITGFVMCFGGELILKRVR